MSLNVTRCPACGSTFNFSPRQLESSGGRARCGACLHVFAPAEHLATPGRDADGADSVFIGEAPEDCVAPAAAAASGVVDEPGGGAPPPQPPPEIQPASAPRRAPAAEQRDNRALAAEPNRPPPRQFQPLIKNRPAKRFRPGLFAAQTALALMLLALLAAQHLWRNLPAYSQVDWLRPGYARICASTGCELPPYSAIDRIASMGANLRNHPDYPGQADARLLTARMYNTAEYPQAFPVLTLRFTSADGRDIALREFAPAEYLKSGPPAQPLLPPGTPAEIELAVLAPESAASTFEISFRAP